MRLDPMYGTGSAVALLATCGPRRQRPCFPASLAGIEGILLRADTVRIVRSVRLLNWSVAVKIDRDVVCTVSGAL